MVRARTAGSSAGDHNAARAKRPSSRALNSKIRNKPNCSSRSAFQLLEALFDFNVDAKRSVLIAQPNNRNISVHVVFHLNDLLLRRTDIRNISDGEVASNLLLDGNARRRALLGARRAHSGEARINAKPRYPKQALQAPAQLAGNRL